MTRQELLIDIIARTSDLETDVSSLSVETPNSIGEMTRLARKAEYISQLLEKACDQARREQSGQAALAL